jgi:hypothetical protein
MITKRQYQKLMSQYQEHGEIGTSAMMADVHPQTARKYIQAGQAPAQLQTKHSWRTRADPLEAIWPQARRMLEDAPELEAKALFEHLLIGREEGLQESHLRTFQRRVKHWRLGHGPDREVFFPQTPAPGRLLQLDWTHAAELEVSIGSRDYAHLLCHAVLPFSNWQWATRCHSESLLSLRQGLQEALFRLGKVAEILQVDNSSAATHQIGAGAERAFNGDFLSVVQHFGLQAQTINVGCPNENGDVESLNGHLKRRIKQHLALRGSRDFSSEAEYDQFLGNVCEKANAARRTKVAQEMAAMRPLPPTRLSEYDELYCAVSSHSTIRVKKVSYSVPARWIGQKVKVEIYEAELKIYAGRELLLQLPRQRGDRGSLIDYRHVIDHLLRKPGAFAQYRFREELFPTLTYRRAFDRLIEQEGQRRGELEYLRLLKLTADLSIGVSLAMSTNGLDALLSECLGGPGKLVVAELKCFLGVNQKTENVPALELAVDLSGYDALLGSSEEEVSHVA